MSGDELASIFLLTGASELTVKARLRPLDRDRPVVASARAVIHRDARAFLLGLGHTIAMGVRKAASDDEFAPLKEAVEPELVKVAKDAAALGLDQVGVAAEDLDAMLSQVNANAVRWAERHAGEMVKDIAATTRDRVSELVARAEEEGWSNDKLADEISSDGVFGDARAETIARTETAEADVQGNLIGWKESGLVEGKEWITSKTDPCDECEPLDGEVVALDAEFPDGDPPIHPRCECDILPVLADAEGDD